MSGGLAIVHLISAPAAGGAEVYVKDMATELLRQGHRPVIGFISRATDIGRSSRYESAYLAELEAKGIAYGFVGHECRRNPLLGAWRTRRFCRDHGADIYHSHLKYALVFGAFLGIPNVHTHHNIRPHAPRWMYPLFNRLVGAYVGISNACAESLSRVAGRSVETIHNAVDPLRVAPGGGVARSPSGRLDCIAVGHIGEQKNLGPLVDAVALLPPGDRNSLHVTIVGEGTARDIATLQQRIAESGLTDTIHLAGNREDVVQLLGRANLYLMTSAWEGLPIALLEATVSGLPFIATNVGGCPEVAERCGNGVIVPVNDPSAIARELQRLLREPGRLRRLSENAVRTADFFSIEPCVRKHVRLYDRLLGRTELTDRAGRRRGANMSRDG